MEEKKKLTFRDIKARAVDGARRFALFFKEFKWDKEHVSVLVKYTVEILLFAFIITFDLCMKNYLYDFVEVKHGGNYTVIDGFLDLTYSENTGMGFGLGKGSTLGITVITAILIAAIIGYLLFFKKEKAYIRIPLIMVAAGGIGNLVDRTQLGYVRDFFEFTFMDFAIFNIADAFVTVGAVVLIIGLIVTLFKPQKDKRADDDAEPAAESADGKVRFGVSRVDEPGSSASDNTAEAERGQCADGADAADTAETSGGGAEKRESASAERAAFTIEAADGKESRNEDDESESR
mgnify:CR=1 FL=1